MSRADSKIPPPREVSANPNDHGRRWPRPCKFTVALNDDYALRGMNFDYVGSSKNYKDGVRTLLNIVLNDLTSEILGTAIVPADFARMLADKATKRQAENGPTAFAAASGTAFAVLEADELDDPSIGHLPVYEVANLIIGAAALNALQVTVDRQKFASDPRLAVRMMRNLLHKTHGHFPSDASLIDQPFARNPDSTLNQQLTPDLSAPLFRALMDDYVDLARQDPKVRAYILAAADGSLPDEEKHRLERTLRDAKTQATMLIAAQKETKELRAQLEEANQQIKKLNADVSALTAMVERAKRETAQAEVERGWLEAALEAAVQRR